jgi:hypothetical protein
MATMRWTRREQRLLSGLRTPQHIQKFLDELTYDYDAEISSPRVVMRTGTVQCLSGALFACAALRELGHEPRLMYIDAVNDDGHCIAVYEADELWGSIAKSKFQPLRSRDPIYSYGALGLSYFDGYYNPKGQRTMRSFTVPIDLERFERRGWRFSETPLLYLDRAIDAAPKAWRLPRRSVKRLTFVTELFRYGGSRPAAAKFAKGPQ